MTGETQAMVVEDTREQTNQQFKREAFPGVFTDESHPALAQEIDALLTRPDTVTLNRSHLQALTSFTHLETVSPASVGVLGAYTQTLSLADRVWDSYSVTYGNMFGTNEIAEKIRSNLTQQVETLMIGAEAVEATGRTVLPYRGMQKEYHSLDDIEQDMEKIQRDFQSALDEIDQAGTFSSTALQIVDRYLFDNSHIEEEGEEEVKTLFVEDRSSAGFLEHLREARVVPPDISIAHQEFPDVDFSSARTVVARLPYVVRSAIDGKMKVAKVTSPDQVPVFLDIDHLLPSGENAPDIIVMQTPNEEAIRGNSDAYRQIYRDYWMQYAEGKRPTVIFYTEGMPASLDMKHTFEGFLFCKTPDEVRNTLHLAKEMAGLREKSSELTPSHLAPLQEQQYDASFDLREWEHETADTYQSLRHILARINARTDLYKTHMAKRYTRLFDEEEDGTVRWAIPYEDAIQPRRPIQTILDCGTGEGRIGGMLARLGYNVIGLDISQEMLNRSQERIKEEGQGLRGERDDPALSYHALRRLREEGVVRQEPILDDEEATRHYLPVKGDFFHLQNELTHALQEWEQRFPAIDKYDFFGEEGAYPNAFSDQRHPFGDAGFDMVMFNWHTFCEIGDAQNQKLVAHQILNVMQPGGELVIEIPDRMVEPYSSVIDHHHQKHPNEPFGTLRDEKPEGGEYSSRYFPDRNELVLLLKSVGFEIDPQEDVQTYFIEGQDAASGKKKLNVKELFITARKSKR